MPAWRDEGQLYIFKACLGFQHTNGYQFPIHKPVKQLAATRIIGVRSTAGTGTHSYIGEFLAEPVKHALCSAGVQI
jgi:hypothetical protein